MKITRIKCKIGKTLNVPCHRKLFSRKRGLVKFSLLLDDDKEIIQMRSGVSVTNSDSLCYHHITFYKVAYEHQQRMCVDPKKTHRKKIRSRSCLRSINLRYAKIFGLIPGKKLCTNCFIILMKEHGLTAADAKESKEQQLQQVQPMSETTQETLNGSINNTTATTTTTESSNILSIEGVSPQNEEKTDIDKKVPSKEYNGSCHCEAVQFKCVAPEKLVVYECNCSICYMKQNSHFIVNKSNFTLLTGEDNLTTYQFNTLKAEHIFCSTCGVQSFYIPRSNPDSYGINPRCLKSFDPSCITIEKFDGQNWENCFAKKPPISTHCEELTDKSMDLQSVESKME